MTFKVVTLNFPSNDTFSPLLIEEWSVTYRGGWLDRLQQHFQSSTYRGVECDRN